jgi:hypothetical protein
MGWFKEMLHIALSYTDFLIYFFLEKANGSTPGREHSKTFRAARSR